MVGPPAARRPRSEQGSGEAENCREGVTVYAGAAGRVTPGRRRLGGYEQEKLRLFGQSLPRLAPSEAPTPLRAREVERVLAVISRPTARGRRQAFTFALKGSPKRGRV